MNAAAKASLVDVVRIDDREWLRYKSFPIDVAIIRGTFADPGGNVSLIGEAANLDIDAIALAAHNSGGKVIAQVRHAVEAKSLPARQVNVRACSSTRLSSIPTSGPATTSQSIPRFGERRGAVAPAAAASHRAPGHRRRAAAELRDGAVITRVRSSRRRRQARCCEATATATTSRSSTVPTAALLEGSLFGYARNPTAIIDAPSQFDFYSGGGLDIAFLGFGQIDAAGNVNVSKLGGLPVGPGGFIDIAQNARKVVFCGSFDTKGVELATGDGRLRIARHGDVRKMVHIRSDHSQARPLRQGRRSSAHRTRHVPLMESVVLTKSRPASILARRPRPHGVPAADAADAGGDGRAHFRNAIGVVLAPSPVPASRATGQVSDPW
jgi:acyl CoA:acetate/3-ketoacid CoA transferase